MFGRWTSRGRLWVALALLTFVGAAATRARWKSGVGAEDLALAKGASVSGAGLAVPVAVDTVRLGILEIRVSATGQT
ncbi:MAG: hypothetical protein ACREK7_06875, partial [Gemmatimonadota bacterium]